MVPLVVINVAGCGTPTVCGIFWEICFDVFGDAIFATLADVQFPAISMGASIWAARRSMTSFSPALMEI
jgi:hypothetical protein